MIREKPTQVYTAELTFVAAPLRILVIDPMSAECLRSPIKCCGSGNRSYVKGQVKVRPGPMSNLTLFEDSEILITILPPLYESSLLAFCPPNVSYSNKMPVFLKIAAMSRAR
jgi:hypothetical protein